MTGQLGWVLRALFSHWRRHPLQGMCLVVGLWLATALWTGVQALNSQARDSYDRAAQLFGGSAQGVLVSPGGQLFEQQLYISLRRQGWPVSPLLEGQVAIALADGERRMGLMGVEPLSLPKQGNLSSSMAASESLVRFLLSPGRTWVATETFIELELSAGDALQLADGRTLPPIEARPGLPPGMLLVDIGIAQNLLDQPGRLSQLLVDHDFAADRPQLPDGVKLVWDARSEDDLQRLTDSFHLNLTALGLLAFVVGLFIVHAAAGLAMEQRRGLMQTLRACGTSLSLLVAALLLELLMLALIGGSLGVLSGFALASLLIGDLAASLRGLYGAQVAGHLSLDAGWWVAGLVMSLGGTLIAGGSSVVKAMRLPVLAWARPQAWRDAQKRSTRRLALLALVLLVSAAGLVVWGSGLPAGFALLAAMLLGSAWLLPLVLQTLLRLGQMLARRPLAQWFWADSQQQLSGLSLALMALLLALAANIGVGSMTEGFRLTFTGWLDQRLAADLYIRPETPAQAIAISAWLDTQPSVLSQLPSWQVQTQVGGWPTEISGVIDHPLYAETWPMLDATPNAWAALAAGKGALISEQLGYRLGLVTGDRLLLQTPSGAWSLEVAGRYADYGNPKGQLLVSAARLNELWPGLEVGSLGVLVESAAIVDLADSLRQHFDLSRSRVIDQSALKAYSRQVFEQTFAATGALNTLTLGVAAVALFTSLLSLADSRLGQLAPLWAMGLRPVQLAWLSLAQMLMLALFTCVLAIPVGLLLAWGLVDVVNVQAFGWRLPWHWFPAQWLTLIALALLAVLLASAAPLWRIVRVGPPTLLRRFAHDA
ncbi:MAG TPA: ABC transporter permease [Pseudomonas xinjiangensis]|uniref:ABC transporter permease n=2 Tax=root TaxID=1 RepID=A0A7V1BPN6_9GAMM|nr:ABC transporter permease [Halopseudomonas xinjiangensis]HEC47309.1 ABC transporter permease [Halopseudomonas xinjiangensis]